MKRGEYIKETAGQTRCHVHALRRQLRPRNYLSRDKNESKYRSKRPQLLKSAEIIDAKLSPSDLQSDAAGQQHCRVDPKNPGHANARPGVKSVAAEGYECCGQHQKKHHNGKDSQTDRS